jgi:hypothetical protein
MYQFIYAVVKELMPVVFGLDACSEANVVALLLGSRR